MRSTMQNKKWVLPTGLLSMVVLFGCEHRAQVPAKNNLRYVQCNKRLPNFSGVTEITLNAKDGIAIEDSIVFVCAGEKVHWKADTGVKTVDISFLNGEWPFKESFESALAGTAQANTPDRVVKDPPQTRSTKAYKYSVHIVPEAGKPIDLDPTIIPMDD
jgi:hypothetical protein